MHLSLPSHLSSLLLFLNNNTKIVTEQVTKKFFFRKTSACRDGTLKLDGNDTTTLSHHPFILCNIANCAHHKTLYMHLAYSHAFNVQSTHICSLHSLPHKRQPISTMFSSNKISQHNLKSNIPYRSSTAYALHSFCIHARQTLFAMLSIASTLQPPTT